MIFKLILVGTRNQGQKWQEVWEPREGKIKWSQEVRRHKSKSMSGVNQRVNYRDK